MAGIASLVQSDNDKSGTMVCASSSGLRGPVIADSFSTSAIGPSDVKEYERKQLLERIGREGATVGHEIPEQITVQGEVVELRDFVFEIKRLDAIPPQERDRVEQAKKNLRRERKTRRERIEHDDISFEQGSRIADTIVGIDRALNAIESLGPTDLEREASAKEQADQKRWMKFLKQVLGHESSSGRRTPGGRGRR